MIYSDTTVQTSELRPETELVNVMQDLAKEPGLHRSFLSIMMGSLHYNSVIFVLLPFKRYNVVPYSTHLAKEGLVRDHNIFFLKE